LQSFKQLRSYQEIQQRHSELSIAPQLQVEFRREEAGYYLSILETDSVVAGYRIGYEVSNTGYSPAVSIQHSSTVTNSYNYPYAHLRKVMTNCYLGSIGPTVLYPRGRNHFVRSVGLRNPPNLGESKYCHIYVEYKDIDENLYGYCVTYKICDDRILILRQQYTIIPLIVTFLNDYQYGGSISGTTFMAMFPEQPLKKVLYSHTLKLLDN